MSDRVNRPKLEGNPFINRKKVTFKLNNKIIEGFITAVPYELAKVNIGYHIELDDIKLVICCSVDGWIQLNKKSELVQLIGTYIDKNVEEIKRRDERATKKYEQDVISKQRSDEMAKHYAKIHKQIENGEITDYSST
jgi:hypothetical protein